MERISINSAISPNLSSLVQEEDKSKRAKRREKRRKQKASSPSNEDGDDTVSQVTARSDSQYIQELEAKLAAAEVQIAKGRSTSRKSIAEVGEDIQRQLVYSLEPVKEQEKMKYANGHSLLELFMRIDDDRVLGFNRQTIAHLGTEVKNSLLMFLTQGNGQEAGLESHQFTDLKDLNILSDEDIQNLLILMVRPNEKNMLVRIMNNIKIPVSPTTAGKPLYLALRPILRGVLNYLQLYEKLYRMLSGEQGVKVNGIIIGKDPNLTLEISKKSKLESNYLDSHESILKNTLVTNGPISARFYDALKATEDRGVSNYLYSAVQAIERIHPRRSKELSSSHKIRSSKESHFKQIMTFDGRQGNFGQVLIETMKYNINMFVTIYDKLVMPFYAMLQVENGDPKSRKLASVLGYILSSGEDDDEREQMVNMVMGSEIDNDNLMHMTSSGERPVKIATNATAGIRRQGQITLASKKPCFAEARQEGACKYGQKCKYSHSKQDLEKLRSDPTALKNIQVLNVLAEHGSPESYEDKVAEFSESYDSY